MSRFHDIKDVFFETLFPSDGRCVFCKKLLLFEEGPFCLTCVETIPWMGEFVCKKCGKEEVVEETQLCIDCGHTIHIYDQGLALFTYREQGKKIIQEIKYEGNKKLGKWIGKKMGLYLIKKDWQEKVDMILPIPLHINRLKERGFNQSEELAKGMTIVLEIPLIKDELLRVKDTPHQTDLSKIERQENIRDAFQIRRIERMKDKKILLVDDVYTTGSTMNACAQVLRQAGAKEIYFSVAAAGKSFIS